MRRLTRKELRKLLRKVLQVRLSFPVGVGIEVIDLIKMEGLLDLADGLRLK
jgi:hypothetical protein